jgi:hypothetical protein
VITGAFDTGDKLIAGDNDTGDQFASGVVYTGGIQWEQLSNY